MRRILAACILIIATGPMAFAGGDMTAMADDLSVAVQFMGGHADMGENHLNIKITGPGGSEITGAKVKVEYGMPAMKNMPSMDYKSRAMYKDGGYMARMNISMEGPWYIRVLVLAEDGKLKKAEFKTMVKRGSGTKGHGH